MNVRLTVNVRYPAPWAPNAPHYDAGQIVPVIPADNIPGEGNYWIATPELEGDCYGILIEPGDYETETRGGRVRPVRY